MIKRDKPARSFEASLLVCSWAVGAFIYGWLFAGLWYQRDYPNLSFNTLGWADWTLALVSGVGAGGVAWFFRRKKTSNSDTNRLFRIVVAVLPALFVVSALATLVLTLATYNGYWVEARQGLATAFAALIAAVGVVVSVAVSYQTGEENRLAQQENLRQQLEHQREIEDERAQREQNKQDAEIIKSLNDRLHEILSRRYSKDENERSASYFQLATLYQDWETLAASSEIVRKQKNSQQRNILKILFGVPQKKDGELVDNRTELEVRTLNSVIQDIFPEYKNDSEEEGRSKKYDEDTMFDLSYLDLRRLYFSGRDLKQANLVEANFNHADMRDVRLSYAKLRSAQFIGTDLNAAFMEEAELWGACFERAQLSCAHLEGAELMYARLEWADLNGAHLEGADLSSSVLGGAKLISANLAGANLADAILIDAQMNSVDLRNAVLADALLERANLRLANLKGASLVRTDLRGADLRGARLDGSTFLDELDLGSIDIPGVRKEVISRISSCRNLPLREELLKIKDLSEELVNEIIAEYKCLRNTHTKQEPEV